MTAGSGAKVRPQKKSGTARMGEKRAPHLKKGGKAHGAKAKVYSFPLNTKIKIKALCALFSAKMSEGKIKVVDTEYIDEPKTKILNKIIDNHTNDERTNFCIITHRDASTNFSLAQRNLKRVIWHDSYTLDVKSLLIADKIIFTMKGLEELI
jgi:large subunit ribosomal protein L4